jgi:hypothetical protein
VRRGQPSRTAFSAATNRAGFEEIEDLGRREILEPVLGVPAKVAASLPGAGGGHLCRARRTSSA